VNASSVSDIDDGQGASNAGWIAGFVIIAVVLAIGGALWFKFHPF